MSIVSTGNNPFTPTQGPGTADLTGAGKRAAPRNSLAIVAQRTLQGGVPRFNIYTKEFVDALSHPLNAAPECQWRMIEEEPAWLPQPWMDVFLAGAAEFIARRADLAPPPWTEHPRRFLPRPFIWGTLPQTRQMMVAETDPAWGRRNFFIGYVQMHNRRSP